MATLEKLQGLNFVLIGGYAVNAYTQPRFSVDCDIVVLNEADAKKVISSLKQAGYEKKEADPDIPYCGDFACLVKKVGGYSVPFDILIKHVVDRKTNSRFSAEWIFENSKIRRLRGKANPVRIDVRIANPEALIIMKLAASRKSDFRDVFMLLGGDINLNTVHTELESHGLGDKLKEFKEYATSQGYKDNLQGVFGKIDDKIFNKLIETIRRLND
ncbi:hypothetical protein HYU14_01535 [Candidatus Woesearchaeota archaeon]|nr:hypothetical protein [Candidatus Woesearchaeota archaeon]